MGLQYLPTSFARLNGLHKMSGKKIVLLNEQGRPWNLNLKYNKAGMHTYAKPGWRRFCAANGMKRGQYTFKLVRKSGPPVIRLCRAEHRPESESESDQESSIHHSCYVGSVTPYSLKTSKLVNTNFGLFLYLKPYCYSFTHSLLTEGSLELNVFFLDM